VPGDARRAGEQLVRIVAGQLDDRPAFPVGRGRDPIGAELTLVLAQMVERGVDAARDEA
jgi:hypothetical protein